MDSAARGKGLSNFLLINLQGETVVNEDLMQSLGRNIGEMYFEYKKSALFLNYYDVIGEEYYTLLK
jgi:hypothetical protein